MSNFGTPWTEEEVARLRELAGKFPTSHISKDIGRGRDGVAKMIRKLKLPGYRIPAQTAPLAAPVPASQQRETEPPRAPLRKKDPPPISQYAYLDYCPNCHAPVSNWPEHVERMRQFGCRRTAA